jgi:hypothetical protein
LSGAQASRMATAAFVPKISKTTPCKVAWRSLAYAIPRRHLTRRANHLQPSIIAQSVERKRIWHQRRGDWTRRLRRPQDLPLCSLCRPLTNCFAQRPHANTTASRPPHPALHVRDDRDTPLGARRDNERQQTGNASCSSLHPLRSDAACRILVTFEKITVAKMIRSPAAMNA